jgi:hypothetical protein
MTNDNCEHCYEDLAYHGHRNLGCPGGRLTVFKSLHEAIYWNPFNKVVQDHRDGTIYEPATNAVRQRLGLPVPWLAEYGEKECREPASELPFSDHGNLMGSNKLEGTNV